MIPQRRQAFYACTMYVLIRIKCDTRMMIFRQIMSIRHVSTCSAFSRVDSLTDFVMIENTKDRPLILRTNQRLGTISECDNEEAIMVDSAEEIAEASEAINKNLLQRYRL